MKTYRLIYSWRFDNDHVMLRATDEQVIHQLHDDLMTVLKSKSPKARLKMDSGHWWERDEPSRYLEIDKLNGSSEPVFHWIERWLCEHGWEPFAPGYFRQEIDE